MSMGASAHKASKPPLVERAQAPRPVYSTCQFYYGRDLYCGEPKSENTDPYCDNCKKRVTPIGSATFAGGLVRPSQIKHTKF